DFVTPTTPVQLFSPARDANRLTFTRIGDAGRTGLFRVGISPLNGSQIFHLELPVDRAGKGLPDYTTSLVVLDQVKARGESLNAAKALGIRIGGLGPSQQVYLPLMEDDGTTWPTAVTVNSAWSDKTIPLSQFTIGRGALLPQGFPGEWNYWVGPASGRGGSGDR